MLLNYTRLLPELYNMSEATFNLHAIAHLAEQVREHGPLILHSAFIFESMLAHLKRLSHGTHGIPDQICKKLAVAQHAEHHVFNVLKGNDDAKEFAQQLLRYNHFPDIIELANRVSFFGPLKPLTAAIYIIEGFSNKEENVLVA